MGCGSSSETKDYTKVDQTIWRGTLKIGLRKATLKKDFSFIGDIDPYCKFVFGKQEQKSEAVEDGGQFPEWKNQEFIFKRVKEDDIVYVQLWDEDLFEDEFLGEGGFALTKVRKGTNGKVDAKCELYGDGEHVGTVELELEFELDPDCKNNAEVLAPDTTGTCIVCPQNAVLQEDISGYFATQNPMVVIKLGDEYQTTAAHIEGGLNPKWSDQLMFTRDTIARDTFIVECQNFSESSDNELIGVGWVSISSALPKDSKATKTVTIYYQGKIRGNVTVTLQFVSDDPDAYSGRPQAQPVQQQQEQPQQQQEQPQQQQQQPQQVVPVQPQRPMNGTAQYTYPNGFSYDGEWVNGMKHGKGKFNQILPGGLVSTYDGDFQNDRFHGVGRLSTPQFTYEGQFEFGRKHGQGIQSWNSSQQRYAGGWQNNTYHGEGEWTNAQGVTRIVIYENGRFVRWNDEQAQAEKFRNFLPAGKYLQQGQRLNSDNGQYFLTITGHGAIRVYDGREIIFEIDIEDEEDDDLQALMDEQEDEARDRLIQELQAEDRRVDRRRNKKQRRKQRRNGKKRVEMQEVRGRGNRREARDQMREDRRAAKARKRQLRQLLRERAEDEAEERAMEQEDDLEPPFNLVLEHNGQLRAVSGHRFTEYYNSQYDDGYRCAQGAGGLRLVVTDDGFLAVADQESNIQLTFNDDDE